MRQRIGKPDQVERRIAIRRRRFGARRQSQSEPREQRGGRNRFLDPLSGIIVRQVRVPTSQLTAAIGWQFFGFGSRDHEIGQQTTNAIMNSLGYVKFFRR